MTTNQQLFTRLSTIPSGLNAAAYLATAVMASAYIDEENEQRVKDGGNPVGCHRFRHGVRDLAEVTHEGIPC